MLMCCVYIKQLSAHRQIAIKPFNPTSLYSGICKTCRSRRAGSWGVVSSGSALFAIIFHILRTKTPPFHKWTILNTILWLLDWLHKSHITVHYSYLGMKGLTCNLTSCMPICNVWVFIVICLWAATICLEYQSYIHYYIFMIVHTYVQHHFVVGRVRDMYFEIKQFHSVLYVQPCFNFELYILVLLSTGLRALFAYATKCYSTL